MLHNQTLSWWWAHHLDLHWTDAKRLNLMVTSKITYESYHSGFLLPAMIKHSENDFCHLTMPQKIYEYSLPPPRSLATRYKTRYPHQIQGLPSWLIAELWCGKTSSYHASRDAGLALFRLFEIKKNIIRMLISSNWNKNNTIRTLISNNGNKNVWLDLWFRNEKKNTNHKLQDTFCGYASNCVSNLETRQVYSILYYYVIYYYNTTCYST